MNSQSESDEVVILSAYNNAAVFVAARVKFHKVLTIQGQKDAIFIRCKSKNLLIRDALIRFAGFERRQNIVT